MRCPKFRDWVTGKLTARVAAWVTISEQQRAALNDRWCIGAPIFVLPNRLRSLSVTPQVHRQYCDVRPLRVLYLGRFDPFQKGLDWLANVLEARHEWALSMSFVFQGRSWYRDHLEALASRRPPMNMKVTEWGDATSALATSNVDVGQSPLRALSVPD